MAYRRREQYIIFSGAGGRGRDLVFGTMPSQLEFVAINLNRSATVSICFGFRTPVKFYLKDERAVNLMKGQTNAKKVSQRLSLFWPPGITEIYFTHPFCLSSFCTNIFYLIHILVFLHLSSFV